MPFQPFSQFQKTFLPFSRRQSDVIVNEVGPTITPALGAELIVDGEMSNAANWPLAGAGWVVGSGVATATAASSLLRQQPLTAGRWYWLQWDFVSGGSGVTGYVGVASSNKTSAGTYVMTGRAANTNAGLNGSSWTGVADNLSAKQITLSTMIALIRDLHRKNGTYTCKPTIAVDSQEGLCIERADENNGVFAYVNRCDGKAYLDKLIGGVWTNVINGAITYVAGQELKVIVNGNDHSLYYNAAQIGATTAINDAGLGTMMYGFNSLAGNSLGTVTANP